MKMPDKGTAENTQRLTQEVKLYLIVTILANHLLKGPNRIEVRDLLDKHN